MMISIANLFAHYVFYLRELIFCFFQHFYLFFSFSLYGETFYLFMHPISVLSYFQYEEIPKSTIYTSSPVPLILCHVSELNFGTRWHR